MPQADYVAVYVAVLEDLLREFMEHDGFAYESHQEAACAALGHRLASREFSRAVWKDVQPCYCLRGPVVTDATSC